MGSLADWCRNRTVESLSGRWSSSGGGDQDSAFVSENSHSEGFGVANSSVVTFKLDDHLLVFGR